MRMAWHDAMCEKTLAVIDGAVHMDGPCCTQVSYGLRWLKLRLSKKQSLRKIETC